MYYSTKEKVLSAIRDGIEKPSARTIAERIAYLSSIETEGFKPDKVPAVSTVRNALRSLVDSGEVLKIERPGADWFVLESDEDDFEDHKTKPAPKKKPRKTGLKESPSKAEQRNEQIRIQVRPIQRKPIHARTSAERRRIRRARHLGALRIEYIGSGKRRRKRYISGR